LNDCVVEITGDPFAVVEQRKLLDSFVQPCILDGDARRAG